MLRERNVGKMQKLKVTSNEAGQRLDKLLAKYLSQAGKGFLYKMLRKKNITLNGKKCDGSERVEEGDEIRLFLADETIEKFSAPLSELEALGKERSGKENAGDTGKTGKNGENGSRKKKQELSIVYEDKNVIIVNKPSGMLSQKAKEGDVSLNEHILNYLIDSGHLPVSQLRTFKPSICNRLDRNTSGLVVAGTSLQGLQIMNAVLKDRSLHKYYQCIVKGKIDKPQMIAGFLKKDEAKNTVQIYPLEVEDSVPIMTEYVPVASNDRATLLRVTLITGRSHQIRAHLASIGHPILGDFKYGDQKLNEQIQKKYKVRSQLLHSWKLVMPEKLAQPLDYLAGKEFIAPLPAAFKKVLKGEGLEADS